MPSFAPSPARGYAARGMPPADLQPMAVAPRAPGDYAPAAGVRAVERVQDAAEPLKGARVLHVSVAGAEGRVPGLPGGVLPLPAGGGGGGGGPGGSWFAA